MSNKTIMGLIALKPTYYSKLDILNIFLFCFKLCDGLIDDGS